MMLIPGIVQEFCLNGTLNEVAVVTFIAFQVSTNLKEGIRMPFDYIVCQLE